MRLRKLIKQIELASLIVLLVVLTGCNAAIIIHPIEPTDFYVTENNDVCMSEMYFTDILKAKLDRK